MLSSRSELAPLVELRVVPKPKPSKGLAERLEVGNAEVGGPVNDGRVEPWTMSQTAPLLWRVVEERLAFRVGVVAQRLVLEFVEHLVDERDVPARPIVEGREVIKAGQAT